MARIGNSVRHAFVLGAALMSLASCLSAETPRPAPAVATAPADPILLGHAAWCGSNPPSGYCPGGHKR